MVTEMAMRGEPWRRPEEEQAEADRVRELELELFRSGSASPTVEGSIGALHGADADVFLEDDLRADQISRGLLRQWIRATRKGPGGATPAA